MGKSKQELIDRQNTINEQLSTLQGRELNAEETAQREKLLGEWEQNAREIKTINLATEAERESRQNYDMREDLKALLNGEKREVTFGDQVVDSGAINQNIHSLIDTINEGLGLPEGVNIVSNVDGNDIWPVSINDAEMQEVGEVEALTDGEIDFDKLTATPHRIGLPIDISYKALDNKALNIAGIVINKIRLAKTKYLAKKVYSQAEWEGNKGPFSGLAISGTITLGEHAYEQILSAVAAFTNKGLVGTPCLVFDAVTEAELKACPKAAGQGGFIIENGKCAGYPYKVSHYINTTLDEDGKLVATADRYFGIGYWEYLSVQFHGAERLTFDGNSKAVAIKGKVNYTYNGECSITDLSTKLNGAEGTQAFGLYKIGAAATPTISGADEISAPATTGNAKRQYQTSDSSGIVATVEEGADWLTATVANNKVTFTWLANSGESAAERSAVVTLTTPTGASLEVTVTQAA